MIPQHATYEQFWQNKGWECRDQMSRKLYNQRMTHIQQYRQEQHKKMGAEQKYQEVKHTSVQVNALALSTDSTVWWVLV